MTKTKEITTKSGRTSRFALAAIAITICGSFMFGAAMAPAAAEDSTTTYASAGNGSTRDFPAQFVNRGAEIELMMEMGD